MAQTGKVCPANRTSWDEALTLYRGQLSFYLDYLLECKCSDDILTKVEAEARDRSVPDEFKLRFMLRILVRQVIQQMRERAQIAGSLHAESNASTTSAWSAPALERLVYFLRDILEYSTRDASLLIGITDAQVERLLSIAQKRIDLHAGPSSIVIENPNETYFRWKFADLHLR